MRLMLIAAMILTPVTAFADSSGGNAFGINQGAAISTLNTGETLSETDRILTPPKPHPLLPTYSVTATRKAGACAVTGVLPITKLSKADRVSATILSQLTEVYGEPESVPFSFDENLLRAWFWTGPTTETELLTLSEYGVRGSGKKAVMLKWEFRNRKECELISGDNPFK